MTIPKTTPDWPYRNETVLTPSGNGQWCKKHKGKRYYFGVLADPEGALHRWRAMWPAIVAGVPVKITAPGCSLKDALQSYLLARMSDYKRGDITWPTYREYRYACQRLSRVIGPNRSLDTIRPDDFRAVMRDVADLSATSRTKMVVNTRIIFDWVSGNYAVKIDFGTDFKCPPRKAVRKQLNNREDKTLTREQVHDMLAVASDQARAIIMLGINGGYGNSDVSALPTKAVDLKAGVIDYYRAKTEAKRTVPLWPETIEALRKVIVPGQELLFLDRFKKPLVRRGVHGVCRMMEEIRAASGVDATFYAFRYTFATKAAELGDDHARKLIMGHVIDGVSEGYVLRFPRDRLKRVTDHVHDWLYAKDDKRDQSAQDGDAPGDGAASGSSADRTASSA